MRPTLNITFKVSAQAPVCGRADERATGSQGLTRGLLPSAAPTKVVNRLCDDGAAAAAGGGKHPHATATLQVSHRD